MSLASTHDVQIHPRIVVKTYRPGSHDAAEREWRALTLLAEYAPGLGPSPITAELATEPARVTMTRLAGSPLTPPVTTAQVEAMADAIKAMQRAIPRDLLAALPPRAGSPAEMLTDLRLAFPMLARPTADRMIENAFDEASAWIRHPALDAFAAEQHEPVLGTGDGNLANYLWNGRTVGIVDFEHSGRSDQPYELAESVEHISLAAPGIIDAAQILDRFDPSPAQAARLRDSRRLLATFWLLAILRRASGETSAPPEILKHQATRVLTLLS
ncbi:aminoglycoside phosphotransferase family protein [Actinomadura sp. WMMA1423]|uniref:aminoglycoside phosphotransferase family protein n=1 Tax=Actinomadura sp. WMMA1423 TaxID=2591108 RepID=UPI001147846C|nr:aminoglycoside phosphotransferase family protein [Actinomadura sp. WMMA1423]